MSERKAFSRREILKIGTLSLCGTFALSELSAWNSFRVMGHYEGSIGITAQGSDVVVSPGRQEIGNTTITVTRPATLAVAPAPVISVTDEPITLSVDMPAGWAKGTRLQGCNARDVNAYMSFNPGSLVIRRTKGGKLLKEDRDYLVDSEWGHTGLGLESRVAPSDTVWATYRYSLLRMDTIQVSPEGIASLKTGKPHISTPLPPVADAGCNAIAQLFINYRDKEVKTSQIYPILETVSQAVTGSTRGLIPKTMAKLKAGGSVKIVCWGDSVTEGGNASRPEFSYPDLFVNGLRERFPSARIELQNISADGSNSCQWLYPEKFPYLDKSWQETGVTWQRIADATPDLVTLEFVNDADQTPTAMEEVYSDILRRIQDLGAELILISPHFTMLKMMGFSEMREPERRPYVLALREFAREHHIALADASARWEHLAKEGIPYLTLLDNTINHPDDRGHRLFAEELWTCFR
jgi:lysophospholipase L1-like esterase